MYVTFPPALRNAEFSRLFFQLEFQESCELTLSALLRLRRELRQTARPVLGQERFSSLFDPPLPADPVARRLVQKPGPAFVIQPPEALPVSWGAGDVLELPVHFWGAGRQRVADFAHVLQKQGRLGLERGAAPFELAGIEAEDAAGNRSLLWRPGRRLECAAPPAIEAAWQIETAFPAEGALELGFRTPGRLIAAGRPLFHATFARLFPFLLRRVTSMLLAHCLLEVVEDPQRLLVQAALVGEKENRLHWQDWRVLQGEERSQELGGLIGSVVLDGEPLGGLLWVVALATLMNVGKSAAFGHGCLWLKRF